MLRSEMEPMTVPGRELTEIRSVRNIEMIENGIKKFIMITVGGSVSTGSTPLIDLLREYDGLKVVDGEFRPGKFAYQLADQIRKGEVTDEKTIRIQRKSTLEYGRKSPLLHDLYFKMLVRLPKPMARRWFGHITSVTRRRLAHRGYEERVPGYGRATGILFDRLAALNRQMATQSDSERLAGLSQCLEEYFHSVSSSFVRESHGQIPVFDQMINPNKLFSEPGDMVLARLLPSAAIIVVSRDVRDQYCDMIRKGKKRYHLLDPEERVDRYIHEYSRRYEDMHRQLQHLPENVLHVRFEDLIFHYQDTKQRVEDFLGIKEHLRPRRHFDPLVAAQNTQLFRDFGNREEIAKIEQYMGQWIYPFESEQERQGTGMAESAGKS